VSVTQLECVFVALGIQHGMRMLHIVICGRHRSTGFFHIFSLMARFSILFFNSLYTICPKHFSF